MKTPLKWIGIGILMLLLSGAALLWFADTGIGHRLIADQIAAQAPKSGLRIKIGRIEGSLYGKARLRTVRLYDPAGLFFEAPEIALDWSPMRWINNELYINSVRSETATLLKRPALRPGDGRQATLPGFDIHIGALSIDLLRIEAPVTGVSRTGRVSAQVDIRSGRARAQITARTSAGDNVRARLDAEPDRDRFDLDLAIAAPKGGLVGALARTQRPFSVIIKGNGSWQSWSGTATATSLDVPLADLLLTNSSGQFGLEGRLMLASITQGRLQRLTNPMIRVSGSARLAKRQLDGRLRLRSAALDVRAAGLVDLAANRFDGVTVDAALVEAPALFANMSGTPLILKARLDGAFATARFDYLLTASRLAFGVTGFENARASGQGRLSRAPITLPVKLTASRVTGVGNVAGGILANLLVTGDLKIDSRTLTGTALRLTSDKLTSRFNLSVDLRTGRYDVGFDGALERYVIPGLGIVDVRSQLSFVPGDGGRGTLLAGRGQAWVRRFDNRFLASLTKGLPRVETGLVRGADGLLRFTNFRLTAPGLTLVGNGIRRRDGTFLFEASGTQAQYGRISRITIDGRIERPRVDVLLAAPNQAMGLTTVRLVLDPDASGYSWRAQGGSTLGAFTGAGSIALPTGAPATIGVAALDVAGITARGLLVSRTDALDGELLLGGNGVSGTLTFTPDAGVQRIAAALTLRNTRLPGPPPLSARRGQIDAVLHLDPAGTRIEATLSGQDLARGGVTLARLAANVRLRDGRGEIRASLAGSRGSSFDLQSVAQIAPDAIALLGSGTIDRKPVALESPARFTRETGGWRLAPTKLDFAGGRINASGLFGGQATEIDATVSQLPLTILDLAYPQLGLGGIAYGTLRYRASGDGLPTGKADIRVRGLTRAGLILSSTPVDVGIAAQLSGTSAGARAVAMSGGKTIGRAQIQLRPGAGPDFMTRLRRAPAFGQLRYNGAADTLWRLTGVEAIDVSGPVAIGADMTGSIDDPRISGSLRTANARIESAVTGMVLTGVKASGRFDGSRLIVNDFNAMSGKDGRLTGSGTFDLSSSRGFAMALDIKADQARLIARDELSATVSGPLTIRSDAEGGLISGDVTLDKSSYRLGRAAAAVAAIAQINVTEINTSDIVRARPRTSTWRLAVKARAPGRVSVSGLGIDSEWRARLDIGGLATAPLIRGQADLVRGDYEFAGRRFDLTRGIIRFDGESPPDPALDIIASGNTQGLNASIRVAGTGLRPEISFSSTPALPQDELLSRLLFGTSITNLSAPEAVQLASAVASLRGGGTDLNPINALRNAIGLDRLRILPADTATGQRTSIAAGKYLTRRIYFEVITDGQGYSATRAEFQITRWLSILSTISNIGRQSATVKVSKDY